MNTILPTEREDLHIELAPIAGNQESTYPFQNEINITDGGEFLDDAVRTKDQPLGKYLEKDK